MKPGPCRCHTYRSPGLQSAYRRGRAAGLFGAARRAPYADDATWAGTHRAAWRRGRRRSGSGARSRLGGEWALSVPEIAAQDAGAKAYALLGEAIELTALPESLEEMADLAGVLSNACPSLWALAEAMEEKLAINRQRTFTARVFGGQVRHIEREGAKE